MDWPTCRFAKNVPQSDIDCGNGEHDGAAAPEDMQATWLDPAIMGPPVVWLASPASDGLTDQRIIATEFAPH